MLAKIVVQMLTLQRYALPDHMPPYPCQLTHYYMVTYKMPFRFKEINMLFYSLLDLTSLLLNSLSCPFLILAPSCLTTLIHF